MKNQPQDEETAHGSFVAFAENGANCLLGTAEYQPIMFFDKYKFLALRIKADTLSNRQCSISLPSVGNLQVLN